MATEPLRTPARSVHRPSFTSRTFSSNSIGSQETFHSMSADPAPLPPSPPPSDDMASGNLDDHPLDCQACRDLLEVAGFPIHCQGQPYTKPHPRLNTSATANEAVSMNDEPTSDPTSSRSLASLLSRVKKTSITSKTCHVWLGSLLGLGSLSLAMVSLVIFTVRSYRMAVWTTRNDELQACIGLAQVRYAHPSEYCLLMQ